MELSDLLSIEPGITSVIGSGGKTTLLHALAHALTQRGTVLLATTTHMYPSKEFLWLNEPSLADISATLPTARVVQVGALQSSGKLGACTLSPAALATLADFVLVEADGSRRLPLKAHASHEPVIADATQKTICVIGASGFGKPIASVVHRATQFCALCGAHPEDAATPQLVAQVLSAEALADCYLINQADTPEALSQARVLASMLDAPVFAGSLAEGRTNESKFISMKRVRRLRYI